MSDPARVQLLALVLRRWDVTARALAGPGMDLGAVQSHLRAMADVGILDHQHVEGTESYAPSPDALARFGGLVLDDAPVSVPGPRPRLDRLVEDLAREFDGVFAAETVERYVMESYELLASRATVRTYLPVLTARFAVDRLTALARAEGRLTQPGTDVLFVCVRNAGRSQIAASVLRSRGTPNVRVRTAGSAPAARIDPQVAAVLRGRGLPAVAEFPKPLTDEVVRGADYVITMGCGDACPLHPGPRYLDWQVPDPAGQPTDVIERVVDEITERVDTLLGGITP